MSHFLVEEDILFWKQYHEILTVQPWGPDGVRIRATRLAEFPAVAGALLDQPLTLTPPRIEVKNGLAILTNGKLRVEVTDQGRLQFFNAATGKVLLEEPEKNFWSYPSRNFEALSGDLYHLEATFAAKPGERFYGLGQHQHGLLNQKGCVIRLQQTNTEIAIPFVLSSRGYGFLWNNPAIGRVELAENSTRWVAEATRLLDYYVVAGDSPSEILERYVSATGRPPLLPEWALGFWQSKLRYRNQWELLRVAQEYKRRNLPISVIVADYFHWTMMGEWKFNPVEWPDPKTTIKELKDMGIELMVSVWPTVNVNSENYKEMNENGLLVQADRNINAFMTIQDRYPEGPSYIHHYDATNPDSRKFIWEKVKKNYFDLGIRAFWLDADEPEIYPIAQQNLRYHLGSAMEVGCIYPLEHQRGFYEGEKLAGEKEIVNLSRSAWAGTQHYGAAVWSGDIPSTFEYLQKSVRAGLNIAVSGIPWWTTDIGGFMGGDLRTDYFKELIVRWFQYGAFCPLFRLHGVREPTNGLDGAQASGGPNEVWSFGERAYKIITRLMKVREQLKPYLMAQNRIAHEKGLPPMRPLFFDFPKDDQAYQIEDQFMLGPDLLVAPILEEGKDQREVYLPIGVDWKDAWSGTKSSGGQRIVVDAPIEVIPVFWRSGSPYYFQFQIEDQ
jgi:alpha-D-xyloside xylohydrolase